MGFGDGSAGSSWTICKQSAPHFRQITTPVPYHSIFYGSGAQPTVSKHWTGLKWNELQVTRSQIRVLLLRLLSAENGKWKTDFVCGALSVCLLASGSVQLKVAHTRLPIVGFRSWSRFLAVSLQVTWVINPAVGCNYFPPGLQLSLQPLRGLLPVLLLGEQRHNGCEQFA